MPIILEYNFVAAIYRCNFLLSKHFYPCRFAPYTSQCTWHGKLIQIFEIQFMDNCLDEVKNCVQVKCDLDLSLSGGWWWSWGTSSFTPSATPAQTATSTSNRRDISLWRTRFIVRSTHVSEWRLQRATTWSPCFPSRALSSASDYTPLWQHDIIPDITAFSSSCYSENFKLVSRIMFQSSPW